MTEENDKIWVGLGMLYIMTNEHLQLTTGSVSLYVPPLRPDPEALLVESQDVGWVWHHLVHCLLAGQQPKLPQGPGV